MKTTKNSIIFLVMIFLTGCDGLFDPLKEESPHLISAETLYENLDGFNAGLNGLYALVRLERTELNNYLGAHWITGTDAITCNYGSSGNGAWGIPYDWGTTNNSLHPQHERTFEWLYRAVNAANTIINRAENEEIDWSGGESTPEENKKRIIGEARAIRAWLYRHLTFGWGDVPLSLDESLGSTIKTDWIRTPVSQVRRQIISDLKFAQENIPVEPVSRGSLTKGAVQTLLSEMYLTIDKPDSALYWANQVINTPQYKLITARYGSKANEPGVPFMDMFLDGNANRVEGNTEALWVWQFELNVIGGSGSNLFHIHNGRYYSIKIGTVVPLQLTLERAGRGVARVSLTKWALDLYDAKDDRGSFHAIRKFFVLKNAEQNAPAPADKLPVGYNYGDTIWMKWDKDLTRTTGLRADWPYSRKAEPGVNPSDLADYQHYNDAVYMRLGSTYLLKAEAQFLLGQTADAAATINVLRRRAHAPEITAAVVNMDFILDERARELALEEDRRWTLLRTGKWYERTKLYNHNGGQLISLRDTIFPIPQAVIDANLNQVMPQNPGYN